MVTISLTACKGGISYEDASGIHQLGVYESGRDGRVYLDAL